jgi:hypothetical protein
MVLDSSSTKKTFKYLAAYGNLPLLYFELPNKPNIWLNAEPLSFLRSLLEVGTRMHSFNQIKVKHKKNCSNNRNYLNDESNFFVSILIYILLLTHRTDGRQQIEIVVGYGYIDYIQVLLNQVDSFCSIWGFVLYRICYGVRRESSNLVAHLEEIS